MKVLESSENYLETILVLKKRSGEVKAVDIARHLGYSKPSISAALKLLKQNGYITVAESGYITLTKEGLAIAHKIYLRHTILSQFLVSLGVSPETAQKDACKIEHYLSAESMEKITEKLRQYEEAVVNDTPFHPAKSDIADKVGL